MEYSTIRTSEHYRRRERLQRLQDLLQAAEDLDETPGDVAVHEGLHTVDDVHPHAYERAANGPAPRTMSPRVIRGGAYHEDAPDLRAGRRAGSFADEATRRVGVRCAWTVPPEQQRE